MKYGNHVLNCFPMLISPFLSFITLIYDAQPKIWTGTTECPDLGFKDIAFGLVQLSRMQRADKDLDLHLNNLKEASELDLFGEIYILFHVYISSYRKRNRNDVLAIFKCRPRCKLIKSSLVHLCLTSSARVLIALDLLLSEKNDASDTRLELSDRMVLPKASASKHVLL